jgi:hypothetical protein
MQGVRVTLRADSLAAPTRNRMIGSSGSSWGSVIAGVIRDENGEPVQNAQVNLMSWRYDDLGRQLVGRGLSLTNRFVIIPTF